MCGFYLFSSFSPVVVSPLSSTIFDGIKTVCIKHIVAAGKDWRQAVDINKAVKTGAND